MRMNYLSRHHTARKYRCPCWMHTKKRPVNPFTRFTGRFLWVYKQIYNQPKGFISPKPSAATNIAPNVVMPTMFAAATSLPPMAFTIT